MDAQIPEDSPDTPTVKRPRGVAPGARRGPYKKKGTNLPEDVKMKQGAFLEAYRVTVNLQASLKAVRVEWPKYRDWCDNDAGFRARWDEIQDAAAQSLEDEAVRRAVEGVKRPVFYRGKPVFTGTGRSRRMVVEHEYSDTLLLSLLRRFRPALYRDNQHVEHSGSVNLVDRLTAARDRLIAFDKKRNE